MANTELRITVYGTADVKDLNLAMSSHNRIIKNTIQIYKDLEASGVKIKGMFSAVASEQLKQINATLKLNQATLEQIRANTENIKTLKGIETAARNVASAKDQATVSSKNFLVAMLQYRLASAAFHEVTRAIHEAIQAYADYQTQVVRTTRIIGNTPANRVIAMRDIERGVTTSNLSIQDTGEAYYQLATFIDRASDRAKAFDATMSLLTATEGDARDTTRLIVQLVEQFGDQMGRNLDGGTKYARMVELIGTAFKYSHMEANEFANAMKYAGPLAAGANVPLEQITGISMTLATLGQRGRMQGTGIQQLIAGTIKSALQGFDVGQTKYTVPLIKTPSGQTDLLTMIRTIIEEGRKLPTAQQLAYGRAVTGSVQGWRALLALNTPAVMQLLTKDTKYAADAVNGLSHNVEDMKKAMQDTLPAQWGMAWKNAITNISDALGTLADKTGILDKLKEFNESQAAGRSMQQQFTNDTPRNMAQVRLQTLQNVLGMVRPGQNITRGELGRGVLSPYTQKWLQGLDIYKNISSGTGDEFGRGGTTEVVDLNKVRERIRGQARALQNIIDDEASKVQTESRISSSQAYAMRGLNPAFAASLSQLIQAVPGITLPGGVHGFRTYGQQAGLYDKYIHGRGNLAARPGGGPHERGLAYDIGGGSQVESQAREYIAAHPELNLGFTVKGEPWHVQYIGSSSGKMQTGPSKSAATAARKAQREAHTGAVRTAEDNFNVAKQDAEQWIDDLRDADIAELTAAHGTMVRMAARLRILEITMHRTMGKGHASGRLQYAQRFEDQFDKLIEKAQADKRNDTKDTLTELIDRSQVRLDYLEHYTDTTFTSPEADRVASYIDTLTRRRALLPDEEGKPTDFSAAKRIELGLSGESARRAGERKDLIDKSIKAYNETGQITTEDWLTSIRGTRESRAEQIGGRDYSIYLNPVQRAQEEITRQRQILGGVQADKGVVSGRLAFEMTHPAFTSASSIRQLQNELLGLDKEAKNTTEGISKLTARLPEVTSAYAISQLERDYSLAERGAARDVMPVSSWLQDKQDRSVMIGRLARARDYAAGLSNIAAGVPTSENRQKAEDAQQALLDMAHEYKYNAAAKYMQQREALTGEFSAGMVGLYHGTTSVGGMVNAMGGKIVDTAIESFSKKLFDPVAGAMLKNTDATKDLTDSINALNSVISGGGGGTSNPVTSAPGGVGLIGAMGLVASIVPQFVGTAGGPGKAENYVEVKGSTGESASTKVKKGKSQPLNKPMSQWQTGDFINAGMAAYSVYQTGAQQGVTLGGVLGGAMAGYQIGGPWGAVVGGALDIFGGLFGHHAAPPSQKNPAFYNSPSDFDYNFYKYRLTGIPQPSDSHILQSNAPVVNVVVNMDGVQHAVNTVVTQNTATATVALRNAQLDNTRPI